jgi:hypothetical protein
MFNNLHHKNLSRLAVAGTATLVSLVACDEGTARKFNKNMQNKPNLKSNRIYTNACNKDGYSNFPAISHQKNKAKQTQFKPNFELKLGSFFKYWLCFSPKSAVKRYPQELFCGLRGLCGYELSQNFLKKALTNLTLYYRVLCINVELYVIT